MNRRERERVARASRPWYVAKWFNARTISYFDIPASKEQKVKYVELWFVSAILFLIWFVLTVFLHKSGMVHLLLISAITVFVVQFAAFRKARHHKNMARR
jgi:Flp pilus assembly protein TadB